MENWTNSDLNLTTEKTINKPRSKFAMGNGLTIMMEKWLKEIEIKKLFWKKDSTKNFGNGINKECKKEQRNENTWTVSISHIHSNDIIKSIMLHSTYARRLEISILVVSHSAMCS